MTERRMAVLCLYDSAGRVLMRHRGNDDPLLPGYWGFFGGMVDGDESPEQTVRREIYNQTEYRPHKPEFFIKEKNLRGGVHVLVYVFVEAYDEEQSILLHRVGEYGWFSIKDALDLDITDERYKTLRKLQRRL